MKRNNTQVIRAEYNTFTRGLVAADAIALCDEVDHLRAAVGAVVDLIQEADECDGCDGSGVWFDADGMEWNCERSFHARLGAQLLDLLIARGVARRTVLDFVEVAT